LNPNDVLVLLRALDIKSQIEEYVIAQEDHAETGQHIHAFVKYEKKVSWAPNRWDLDTYHGHYVAAKSWKAVQTYCKKDGNFIASIDTESAQQKRAKNNRDILTGDLTELLESGALAALQLPNAIKARAAYKLLKVPLDQSKCRGIWIYGPPHTGKSHYVHNKVPKPELFLKAQNKWWDGYTGEENVLIDDFDKKGECLSHYLKIWSDKWACTGEIKGASIPLNYKTLYITSNYHPREIFDEKDEDLLSAITRRFEFIYMEDRYNGPN